MLRRLLFVVAIFVSCHALAQSNNASPAPSENSASPEVDYKLIGAPMPVLRYILYHDSASKTNTDKKVAKNDTSIIKTQTSSYITSNTVITSDTVITAKGHNKKKKK